MQLDRALRYVFLDPTWSTSNSSFIWLLPDSSPLVDVLNALISAPVSAYTTLVGFHLADQAYRQSNQSLPAAPANDFIPMRTY